MKAPAIYVWTHDSVALGEDGPTHQPIEQLTALRAIPGLDVVRPADANEVAYAWLEMLKHKDRPAGIALSRQNLPVFERGEGEASGETFASAKNVGKGAYILAEAPNGTPDVILIATGSEVQIAVEAREQLKGEGINARVVSAPSLEWFFEQSENYRDQVLPKDVTARVSVEAGIAMSCATSSATRAAASRSSTSVPRPTTRRSSRSSASRRSTSWPPRRNRSRLPDPPGPGPVTRIRPFCREARLGPATTPPGPQTTARRPMKEEDTHMAETTPTAALSEVGVSIWLDDLSRELLETGKLEQLIAEKNVVGVTTNPTIFASALAKGERYDAQVKELAAAGTDVTSAIFEITTQDVANASDVFKPIYDETKGFDGRVSIEVEPGLAHETQKTIEQAKFLFDKVGRENVLIKIPATLEGLEAITEVIAAGISVNVTLIFSLERYRAVIDAYLGGLEKAKAAGHDLSKIHSVASFFVSRVDSEIDKRLDAVGTDEAKALKSKAGIANAQLAYQVWTEAFATERALGLLEAGANTQRPLWPRRCQGPVAARHALRDRARRPEHRQHHAGQDARRDVRPR